MDASQHTKRIPINQRPKFGATTSSNEDEAVKVLFEKIHQEDSALTVIFCSPRYDTKKLGYALEKTFASESLIGCTSAGEISPIGYTDGSLAGFSLPADGFTASSGYIDNLAGFEISRGTRLVSELIADLNAKQPTISSNDTFAFLMIDGLSCSEEPVVSSLYSALGNIPLFGGSAGDNLDFNRTLTYYDGTFRTNSAVLTLVRTKHPFMVFKTQHFVSSEKKMVVTEADPNTRTVSEINGEPAGMEYARLVGLAEEELTPMIFANFPVLVKIGGTMHVRSIQKVNDDGSLTFFCAIDKGAILTVAEGVDIIENLEELIDNIQDEIGVPQLIIGCDCVLRSLELERNQLKYRVGKILSKNNTIGFNTYGEQFQAMHVNQTFTGVAIGHNHFFSETEAGTT